MSAEAVRRRESWLRSMVDYYATTMRTQMQTQFQYRAVDVHVHARDGRRADDLSRRLVDDRALARRHGQRAHAARLRRVLHRLDARAEDEHRLHAVRLGAADSRGPAVGDARPPAASDPLRPRDVRGAEARLGAHVPADRSRALAHLPPGAPSERGGDRRLPRRDLGRVPHPHDVPLAARHGQHLDDARERDLPDVRARGAPALRAAAAADAHAALVADARRVAAVQVDVLLPDRGARRKHVVRLAHRRARHAAALDGDRLDSSSSRGACRCGTTRRSAIDPGHPARLSLPAARRRERAAVPRELLRRRLPVAALGCGRPRRARARVLAHDDAERLDANRSCS